MLGLMTFSDGNVLLSGWGSKVKTLLKLLKPGEARQCKILLKSDDHSVC